MIVKILLLYVELTRKRRGSERSVSHPNENDGGGKMAGKMAGKWRENELLIFRTILPNHQRFVVPHAF